MPHSLLHMDGDTASYVVHNIVNVFCKLIIFILCTV